MSSIKNNNLPNNCVIIGPQAYCIEIEKPNQISKKLRIAQSGNNLWENDPNSINANDNKLVANNTCVLNNGCTNDQLKEGCVAICMIKPTVFATPSSINTPSSISNTPSISDPNKYISQVLAYNGVNWTNNTLK